MLMKAESALAKVTAEDADEVVARVVGDDGSMSVSYAVV
jgi:hypothetical protein